MFFYCACAVLLCTLQGAYSAVCEATYDDVPPFVYPQARRDESVVDEYFGVQIKDPYRWLEDPDSRETEEFVNAQNELTRPYLDSCPVKNKIHTRLSQLWNYPKYSSPFKQGNRYFFLMNSGLQKQNVLYVQDTLDGEARVFLDPNTLSEDGTIALSNTEFTEDGSLMAYSLAANGSDWNTLYIKDVETGVDYPDKLERLKFGSFAWTKDNKGLFYAAYPEVEGKKDGSETLLNRDQKLYYHRLNTLQSEDVLVAEFPEDPLLRSSAKVSDDGKYLFVYGEKEARNNLLYFVDLSKYNEINGKLPLNTIIDKFEANYEVVTNEGSICYIYTNKGAPKYKVVKVDLNNPAEENWETIISEHKTDVLDAVYPVDHDKFVLHYLRDVKSVLQLHSEKTGELLQTFPLEVGSILGFSGKKSQSEIFYSFASFLTPGIFYHVDLTTPRPYKPVVFRETKIKGFDASQYEAKQIFYDSKDGTRIPMFIVSKKNIPRNGRNPTLLYGYGGFSVNIQPSFSVMRLVFMQHFNGILAIPNIRGGGEYGESWHDAGRVLKKQNGFDDFQAAAEYLIRTRYTRPSLITIHGASNGGLLVAASINQRPELFGAALAQVGVLDMLRYHKFTIGYAWASDYGRSDNETEFYNLLKFSPLHNIKAPSDERSQYPATLVLTADHDDRVVPLHSLKFIAELQHTAGSARAQTHPLLARIDTKAGHGGGKPTDKLIDENTDLMCFMSNALNLKYVN